MLPTQKLPPFLKTGVWDNVVYMLQISNFT